MSALIDPIRDDAQNASLSGPLSSIEFPPSRCRGGDPACTDAPTSPGAERPPALRRLRPGPEHAIPDHRYDPVRQVAVDSDGEPVEPNLKKDWTTIEGTHTDGDGGDNELWEWEESTS